MELLGAPQKLIPKSLCVRCEEVATEMSITSRLSKNYLQLLDQVEYACPILFLAFPKHGFQRQAPKYTF